VAIRIYSGYNENVQANFDWSSRGRLSAHPLAADIWIAASTVSVTHRYLRLSVRALSRRARSKTACNWWRPFVSYRGSNHGKFDLRGWHTLRNELRNDITRYTGSTHCFNEGWGIPITEMDREFADTLGRYSQQSSRAHESRPFEQRNAKGPWISLVTARWCLWLYDSFIGSDYSNGLFYRLSQSFTIPWAGRRLLWFLRRCCYKNSGCSRTTGIPQYHQIFCNDGRTALIIYHAWSAFEYRAGPDSIKRIWL